MIGMFGKGSASSSLLCTGLLLGLAAAGPVRAEGEFMRDAMSSIGLIEPERPTITYRERAPLAMPPKRGNNDDLTAGLPIPQSRQSDPQWPKDPEIRQRERAAIEADKPIVRGSQGRLNDNNVTLSAEEMQGGRRAGAEIPTGPTHRSDTRESVWINPLDLFKGAKAEPSSDVEPERSGLTDPPTGYRKPLVKVAKPQQGPVGGSISGNEEADPRAYLRSQAR